MVRVKVVLYAGPGVLRFSNVLVCPPRLLAPIGASESWHQRRNKMSDFSAYPMSGLILTQ